MRLFYEWALLHIGAWQNITLDQLTGSSGNASELRQSTAWGYDNGQVWEGFRHQWVHETGVIYTDVTGGTHVPQSVVVYVDGIQQSGNFAINYPLGQVIFDSAISTSSTVKAEYAFKNVHVYIADEAPWFQQLQYGSWDADEMFRQVSTGDWFIGANHRVQMPTIVINAIEGKTEPYALGNGKVKRIQPIDFYVISENKCLRDNLLEAILLQTYKTTQLIDLDSAAADHKLPLDCNGNKVGLQYPDLISNYCWCYARSEDGRIFDVQSPHSQLYFGKVRHTYEIIFSNIC